MFLLEELQTEEQNYGAVIALGYLSKRSYEILILKFILSFSKVRFRGPGRVLA